MPSWPDDQVSMEDAVYAWVQSELTALSGAGFWSVIWAEQNAPNPGKPYATLNWLDAPQAVGMSSTRVSTPAPPVAQNDEMISSFIILEIQLYSATKQDGVRAGLRQGIEAEYPHRENLRAAGLSVSGNISDRDLTEVFSSENEYRGVIEVQFNLKVQRTIQNYPWIETVNPTVIGVS